jgi:hypothetical protein
MECDHQMNTAQPTFEIETIPVGREDFIGPFRESKK